MDKPFSLAVKAVLVDSDGRCLLIRRAAGNHFFGGAWEWPGGKVDPGEDFASAVVRETREETNLEVRITGLAGALHFEMPAVNVVMLCMNVQVVSGEIRLSEEHDQFIWVPWAELDRWELAGNQRDFMLSYASRAKT